MNRTGVNVLPYQTPVTVKKKSTSLLGERTITLISLQSIIVAVTDSSGRPYTRCNIPSFLCGEISKELPRDFLLVLL